MLSVEIISHCLAYHHRELYRTENKPSHKSDCALFLRLYIAGQTRDGDLDIFFQTWEPCIPSVIICEWKTSVWDKVWPFWAFRKALQNMWRDSIGWHHHTWCCCRYQYAENHWCEEIPIICDTCVATVHQIAAAHVYRIDTIWDVYLENSLKSTTRETRGRGIRQLVAPSNTILGNWQRVLEIARQQDWTIQLLGTPSYWKRL